MIWFYFHKSRAKTVLFHSMVLPLDSTKLRRTFCVRKLYEETHPKHHENKMWICQINCNSFYFWYYNMLYKPGWKKNKRITGKTQTYFRWGRIYLWSHQISNWFKWHNCICSSSKDAKWIFYRFPSLHQGYHFSLIKISTALR